MFTPYLTARIKQAYDLTCERIKEGNTVALMVIAQRTGQPQIGFFRWTTKRLRNEVIDLHRHTDNRLRRETIATPVACLSRHLLAQGLRNVGATHAWVSKSETLCPRALSKAAACARTSIVRSYWRTKLLSVSASASSSPSR